MKLNLEENNLVLLKTITFKSTTFLITFSFVWLLTGSAAIGGFYAVVRGILGVIAYAAHEKIWFWFLRNRNKQTETVNGSTKGTS